MEQNKTMFPNGFCGMSPDLFSKWIDLNIAYQKSNLWIAPTVSQFQNAENGDQFPLPLDDGKKQEAESS